MGSADSSQLSVGMDLNTAAPSDGLPLNVGHPPPQLGFKSSILGLGLLIGSSHFGLDQRFSPESQLRNPKIGLVSESSQMGLGLLFCSSHLGLDQKQNSKMHRKMCTEKVSRITTQCAGIQPNQVSLQTSPAEK